MLGKSLTEHEGKPHVSFEVAGDGNQDRVNASEALSKETESNWSASPKSQAPFPDPTTRPGYRRFFSEFPRALWLALLQRLSPRSRQAGETQTVGRATGNISCAI